MNTSTHDPVARGVARFGGLFPSGRCTVDAVDRHSPAPNAVVRQTALVHEP